MPQPTSVNVSNSISLYDAFKTLTTDRAQNRGTIEVVRNGQGGVATLKCAQHHFYSSSVVLPNKDLSQTLRDAVTSELDRLGNKMLFAIDDSATGDEGRAESKKLFRDKADQVCTTLKEIGERLLSGLSGEKPRTLARKDIAKIVMSVESLKASLQKSMSVEGLLSFAETIEEAQRVEEAKENLIEAYESTRPKLVKFIKEVFDPDRCAAAAKKDMKIETCRVSDDIGSTDLVCKKNPFSSMSGTTDEIVQRLAKTNPGAKICTEIAADATHWACGAFVGWDTQEESVVRNLDPDLGAHLMGTGQIKPEIFGSQLRTRYTQGPNHLSTGAGWMTHTKFAGVKNSEVLFSSLPTLGNTFDSWDLDGNTDYSCFAHKLRNGVEPTDVERENVRACNDALYQKYGNKKEGVTDDQFKEAAQLLMFGDFDTLHGDPNTVAESVIKLVKSGEHKRADKSTGISPLDQAKATYQDTVRLTVRAWIATARKRGCTHFVGMAVGCKTFRNDPNMVARIIAEEFVVGGGNMKYVYANFNGGDPNAQIFEDAFKTAWENREQLRAKAAAQVQEPRMANE